MLATQLNHLITQGKMEQFTIIKANKVIVNKISNKTGPPNKELKKIIILLEIEVLVPGGEVSNPLRELIITGLLV